MAITFLDERPAFDIARDVVTIKATSGGEAVHLAMSLHEFRLMALAADSALTAHDLKGAVIPFVKTGNR